MKLVVLLFALAGCDNARVDRVDVQDFSGNLGPAAPDMGTDLAPPADARYFVDLEKP